MDKPNTIPVKDTYMVEMLEFVQDIRKLMKAFDCDLKTLADRVSKTVIGQEEEIATLISMVKELQDDSLEDYIGE